MNAATAGMVCAVQYWSEPARVRASICFIKSARFQPRPFDPQKTRPHARQIDMCTYQGKVTGR
eukprot:6213436-Pleurochrysis_carterae.AAC.3